MGHTQESYFESLTRVQNLTVFLGERVPASWAAVSSDKVLELPSTSCLFISVVQFPVEGDGWYLPLGVRMGGWALCWQLPWFCSGFWSLPAHSLRHSGHRSNRSEA